MGAVNQEANNLVADKKDEEWIQLFDEWRKSGLSGAEWVREREDISYQQFMRAKKKLFPEEVQTAEFIEKEITWSALNLEIPSSSLDVFINDCRIVVQSGFDQELLREVVEVLKNAN